MEYYVSEVQFSFSGLKGKGKIMKHLVVFLFVIFISLARIEVSAAEQSGFGAGIIIGEPTGISLKYNNFAAGIAWSIDDYFHVHCDYWFHQAGLVKQLDWFIGGGVKIKAFDDHDEGRNHDDDHHSTAIGVRVPVGLQYFVVPKVEIFGEIVPGIYLFPDTDFDMDGGIGARYYF